MSVTLPGDLVSPVAGPLLATGSPVVGADEDADWLVAVVVIPAYSDEDERVLLGVRYQLGHATLMVRRREVALDLSDPVGMDIAARWLAAHHGLKVMTTAPGWYESDYGGRREWCMTDGEQDVYWWTFHERYSLEYARPGEHNTAVSGISALTDPAEALRAACLAAVGRTG